MSDEIGGLGFGDDQFPSEYNYHTQFSIYANGSNFMDTDPWLPIEQEQMGRGWTNGSIESGDTLRAMEDPSSLRDSYQGKYRNVYTMKDPMRRRDYYLDSPAHGGKRNSIAPRSDVYGNKEHLSEWGKPPAGIFNNTNARTSGPTPSMTNVPTFYSRDPFRSLRGYGEKMSGSLRGYGEKMSGGPDNQMFMIFFVMLALFVVVSCIQHCYIIQLQAALGPKTPGVSSH